jgi:WD40 repeat protein
MADFKNSVLYLSGGGNEYKVLSRSFNSPHGISFLTDRFFLVANRYARLSLYEMPEIIADKSTYKIKSLMDFEHDFSNVCAHGMGPNVYSIFAMSNFNYVTRYIIDLEAKNLLKADRVISRHLNTSDGIAINPARSILACCNHDDGKILLYSTSSSDEPMACLTGPLLPHGVAFSSDGKHLVVTDAGSPFLFIYRSDPEKWKHVKIVRGLSKDKFIQSSNEEGGIKGIDINGNDVVISSEYQPHRFLKLDEILNMENDAHAEKELKELSNSLRKSERLTRDWIY